jgi:hypothetical protein
VSNRKHGAVEPKGPGEEEKRDEAGGAEWGECPCRREQSGGQVFVPE